MGAKTDVGCPGRYSSVQESDFHVDYQNPKVGYGGELFDNFRKIPKVTKLHEITGNEQKSVWEHHLGAETIHFGDLGCPGRYSGVLEGDFHVDSQNPKVGMEAFFFF